MEHLDHSYLNDLVRRAGHSSDAFAELYAATAKRVYDYLQIMTGDAGRAEQLLEDVYLDVLKDPVNLQYPELFLCRTCRIAWRKTQSATEDDAILRAILALPLAESQVSLMYAVQHLPVREIGEILNLGNSTIRRRLRTAERHIRKNSSTDFVFSETVFRRSFTNQKLTQKTADEQLASIFESAGREPNTTPIEALSSYAVYRKERFLLQRMILAGLMMVFLLLPLLFVLPRYQVTCEAAGERGLPVYHIDVSAVLPVGSVTASMQNHALPVYEAGSHSFTVEPIRNGELSISVALFNRQRVIRTETVTAVDMESPVLTDSEVGDETFLLHVADAGIGVDYDGIYAVDESGTRHLPVSADEETGVLFPWPEEAWDVYVPDRIGNTLHLAVHF